VLKRRAPVSGILVLRFVCSLEFNEEKSTLPTGVQLDGFLSLKKKANEPVCVDAHNSVCGKDIRDGIMMIRARHNYHDLVMEFEFVEKMNETRCVDPKTNGNLEHEFIARLF
jgi:hypothetical protein